MSDLDRNYNPKTTEDRTAEVITVDRDGSDGI
jgi:hypothetical protein